jgi:ribokinase
MDKIVVVGSLNMDLVVRVVRIPNPGETILGQDFLTIPGGKGANQAVAAARMGGNVTMVGCVGRDSFGDTLVDNLSKEGIDVSHIQQNNQTATGVASITVDEKGQNSIVVTSGANMKITPLQIENAFQKIDDISIVVLQLETPVACVGKAIEIAKARKALVLLNPSPVTAIPENLYPMIDVLVPNEIELAQLTDNPSRCLQETSANAQKLISRGVKSIIVTLGRQGVLVVGENLKITHLQGHEVLVVDTTAAGDAFMGGLAVGLAEGLLLPEAACLGNATAALSVTRMGAQPSLPHRKEVEDFLALAQ